MQTEDERVILSATLCIFAKCPLLERSSTDNLIPYRTVYLTYQHILQTVCKLDIPNLHQFEMVADNDRRPSKMGKCFAFLFIKRKRIPFIHTRARACVCIHIYPSVFSVTKNGSLLDTARNYII